MPLHHSFSSLIQDNPTAVAAGKVPPSEWNKEHVLVGVSANAVLFSDPDGHVAGNDKLTFDGNALSVGSVAGRHAYIGSNGVVCYADGGESDQASMVLGGRSVRFYLGIDGANQAITFREDGVAQFNGGLVANGTVDAAALLFPPGSNLDVLQDGAFEYDGSVLSFTVGTVRHQLAPVIGGGSGAETFFYRADANTTNMSDPGTGKMRWNNADQQAADLLIFDWLTEDGFDPVQMFLNNKVGTTFIVQQADFSLNHQVWKMTAPAINGPDYFTVPVELVSASGAGTMQHNKRVAVLLQVGGTGTGASTSGQVLFNLDGEVTGDDKFKFDPATGTLFSKQSRIGTLAGAHLLAYDDGGSPSMYSYTTAAESVLGNMYFYASDFGVYAGGRSLAVGTTGVTTSGTITMNGLGNVVGITAIQLVSGVNAFPLFDLATTWNTTGSPTAIKLNVTNTASGAASRLIDLRVGGVSKFYVDKLGAAVATSLTVAANAVAALEAVPLQQLSAAIAANPGPIGPQGPQGIQGPVGPQGATGAAGISADIFNFTFSSNTAEPPTGTQIRLNNATQSLATKLWVVDDTADGWDIRNLLAVVVTNDRLTLQDKVDNTKIQRFTVTGPPVQKTGYTEFPIAFFSGGSAITIGGVLLAIVRSGIVGGANTQVIFNDGGAAAGDPSFVFNKITKALSLYGLIYPVPTVDNTASGPTTSDYQCGYTPSVIGELVFLDATFTWQKASAVGATNLFKYMLGIVLEVKNAGQAMKVALPGATIWASAAFPALTNGPVFMSETPGQLTQAEPVTPASATRCVGWGVHADKLYFYPSPDYGTHI